MKFPLSKEHSVSKSEMETVSADGIGLYKQALVLVDDSKWSIQASSGTSGWFKVVYTSKLWY